MKTCLYLVTLLLPALPAIAQNKAAEYRKRMMDSIKNIYLEQAAIANPVLRQASISTDIIAPAKIRSDLFGKRIFDGKIKQIRTTALINVPVTSWGKNSVKVTFSLFQQHFQLSDITSYEPRLPNLEGKTLNKLTVGFTGNYTRLDSLFGHQVIYTASVSGLTGRSSSIQKFLKRAGVEH